MDRILGHIYVSSYQPLAAGIDFSKYKITHILSVIKGELPENINKLKTMQISVDDREDENIMDHFVAAIKFIDSALFQDSGSASGAQHKGAVLVHCSEGVSRSVAFTSAYLMYKYKLSLANSLYAIQRKRPQAQPNAGFMEQLAIFEEALKHQEYDLDKVELIAEQSYRDWIFKHTMEDTEARERFIQNESSYADVESGGTGKVTQLRCKKCRQPLALSKSFILHERPEIDSRHATFLTTSAHSNKVIGMQKASEYCSHIFVEPLTWMKPELEKGELLGKFYCPNSRCGTKVGTYSWKGSRCSCGRWVVPGLSLQTAKVDEAYLSVHAEFETIKHDSEHPEPAAES